MTSKQRLLSAINRTKADRLPVTTHHVMPWYLDTYLEGMSSDEFFDYFGLDPIKWVVEHTTADPENERPDPNQGERGFLDAQRFVSDTWRIEEEKLTGYETTTTRYTFVTPRGNLSMVLQSNDQTAWVYEHLIKKPSDIDLIGEFATKPVSDNDAINRIAESYGERGIIRSHVPCFDIFGQPGCWQDACCLVGTEHMIMATYDDPEWVHSFLGILRDRKLHFVTSMKGAQCDIMELGGGSASTTVISPKIFETFVAPYDSAVIKAAQNAGQRISYHTCGGMMPILEQIADMGPDAMETFTPPSMGADVDIAEAKRRIGERVCMIGGFDQFHYLVGTTPEETRKEVRRCFEAAGENGGYILAPSDHFYDADPSLLTALAEEAHRCTY